MSLVTTGLDKDTDRLQALTELFITITSLSSLFVTRPDLLFFSDYFFFSLLLHLCHCFVSPCPFSPSLNYKCLAVQLPNGVFSLDKPSSFFNSHHRTPASAATRVPTLNQFRIERPLFHSLPRICIIFAAMDLDNIVLISATGLGVAALTAIPGFFALQAQIRNRTPKDNFYEDEDGKATPESIAAFSNTRRKSITLVFSITAFATQLAVAVLALLGGSHNGASLQDWLIMGSWVNAPLLCAP